MDFDETRLYFSHQQLQTRNDDEEADVPAVNENDHGDKVDLNAVRRHFREFLSE
jgi:hypothetical protein